MHLYMTRIEQYLFKHMRKMDSVKVYLTPKCFSMLAFITSICHILCGVILTGITRSIASEEKQKFSCNVESGKSFIETSCFSKYQQTYNSPVPFYGYVILSFGVTGIVSCIYSLCVKSRVERVEQRLSDDDEMADATSDETSSYVFNSYIGQLSVRCLFGVLFTVLQFEVFRFRRFQSEFNCVLKALYKKHLLHTRGFTALNSTSVMCLDATATEKTSCGIIVAGLHVFFSFVTLGELLYLLRRVYTSRVSGILFNHDNEFISSYFLGIQRTISTGHRAMESPETVDSEVVYKNAILGMPFPFDVNYEQNTSLDEMFVDLVIHTKRAQYEFGKEMKRHEIHDVYTNPPDQSRKIEQIEDLFHPNRDTKGQTPRKILVVGRAGIGKTTLTRKIQFNWANDINEFYQGKILFYFKFRWFNMEAWHNMTLKEFLCHGTGHVLNNSGFENIFQEISEDPSKAILIFDGLDESNLEMNDLETIYTALNDPALPMSAINIFLKLSMGNLLDSATVLTTSRPNASEIYLKLAFDRQVEILGFTHDEIKEYVEKFCENINEQDMKEKIWNHIKNSGDLLSMCYIPVNCLIVCVSLLQSIKTHGNDDQALPTTLTELYKGALIYFKTHHHRSMNQRTYDRTLQGLERLAFQGVANRQLIFNSEIVNKRMENSGLLHRLPNVIFPIHVQFCFLHLSLQEFLAALHVAETYSVDEIDRFIAEKCNDGKWHLVIQFLAGILVEKMERSDSYRRCATSFTRHLQRDFFLDKMSEESKIKGTLMMKCFQEIKDEEIIKQVASNMELCDDNMVRITCGDLFPGDWYAIVCLLLHITTIKGLYFSGRLAAGSCSELANLLFGRCFEKLTFSMCVMGASGLQDLMLSSVNTTCKLHHNHVNLTHLDLSMNYIGDTGISLLCHLFKNNNARFLTHLNLGFNNLTSTGISRLFNVLGNQLSNLSSLNVSGNQISDEGVRLICDEMLKSNFKLTELGLYMCEVTDESLPRLCDVLQNGQCSRLALSGNQITDKHIAMLWDVIRQDNCSLIDLNLLGNLITDTHVPFLCECLADEHCRMKDLGLFRTRITASGKSMLVAVQQSVHCQTRGLKIAM